MSSTRQKLEERRELESAGNGKVKIGANARQCGVAFIAKPDNESFKGGAAGFFYGHGYAVFASAGFRNLCVVFSGHRVTLEGGGLETLFHHLLEQHASVIRESDDDPLHAAAENRPVVSRMTLEDIE